jgi:hypothetical protein
VLETRPEFQRWFLAEIRLGCQTSGRSRQIFLST